MSKGKVLLGLSGGVDSSVAGLILKRKGYKVDALFMRNWEDDDGSPYCSIKEDFLDAAFVADQLKIELFEENFAKEYKEKVFNYFLNELKFGRTPNPDILCNREIKFKSFLDYALNIGADFIATGHYASLNDVDGVKLLVRSKDLEKDQTYFLHEVKEKEFEKCIFH